MQREFSQAFSTVSNQCGMITDQLRRLGITLARETGKMNPFLPD
jgi:hypothetical protein